MRVLFSGSRYWADRGPIEAILNTLPSGTTVGFLAGGIVCHRGDPGLPVLVVPVGAALFALGVAGTDRVFVFPLQEGVNSRGTWNLVSKARAAGLDVVVYNP